MPWALSMQPDCKKPRTISTTELNNNDVQIVNNTSHIPQSTPSTRTIIALPRDLIGVIREFLPLTDLFITRRVSKHFYCDLNTIDKVLLHRITERQQPPSLGLADLPRIRTNFINLLQQISRKCWVCRRRQKNFDAFFQWFSIIITKEISPAINFNFAQLDVSIASTSTSTSSAQDNSGTEHEERQTFHHKLVLADSFFCSNCSLCRKPICEDRAKTCNKCSRTVCRGCADTICRGGGSPGSFARTCSTYYCNKCISSSSSSSSYYYNYNYNNNNNNNGTTATTNTFNNNNSSSSSSKGFPSRDDDDDDMLTMLGFSPCSCSHCANRLCRSCSNYNKCSQCGQAFCKTHISLANRNIVLCCACCQPANGNSNSNNRNNGSPRLVEQTTPASSSPWRRRL